MTSDSDEEVGPRRKSSYQKDENHMLRQEQIQLYKSTVLKEARDQRMKLRQGGRLPELPKKKKRVSFEKRKLGGDKKEDGSGEVLEIERRSENGKGSGCLVDQDNVENPALTVDTGKEREGTTKNPEERKGK